MNDHYFTERPLSDGDERELEVQLRGRRFRFWTDSGVFSKTAIDAGTRLLIDALACGRGDTVIDLGCGYGPIGAAAAHLVGPEGRVFLIDVNERAAALARRNMAANGLDWTVVIQNRGLVGLSLPAADWVLMNPPIRAGKAVVRGLVQEAMAALVPGGSLLLVLRTKQGAKSMTAYLQELYGTVDIVRKSGGFRVLQVTKEAQEE